jgi:hypothetical protein
MAISHRIGVVLGVSLIFLAAVPSLACGDKVAALGSGVPFERVMAHHSAGRVVVYLNSSAAANSGEDAQHRLVRALQRAGHRVNVAHTEAELAAVLQAGPADVVVADLETLAQPRQSAVAAACLVRLGDRKTGSLVRAVDDIVARRNAAGDYSCDASGRQGI